MRIKLFPLPLRANIQFMRDFAPMATYAYLIMCDVGYWKPTRFSPRQYRQMLPYERRKPKAPYTISVYEPSPEGLKKPPRKFKRYFSNKYYKDM